MRLLICIIVCQLAGVIGALSMRASVSTWYSALIKPFFNPPSWVFAPAWTILYTLMGVAAFIIWRKGLQLPEVRYALLVFSIQLILNMIWTPAFFGLRSPLAGFIVIIMLWIAILITILSFYSVSRAAAILLIPYIIWVSFAAVLNGSILYLNR